MRQEFHGSSIVLAATHAHRFQVDLFVELLEASQEDNDTDDVDALLTFRRGAAQNEILDALLTTTLLRVTPPTAPGDVRDRLHQTGYRP